MEVYCSRIKAEMGGSGVERAGGGEDGHEEEMRERKRSRSAEHVSLLTVNKDLEAEGASASPRDHFRSLMDLRSECGSYVGARLEIWGKLEIRCIRSEP